MDFWEAMTKSGLYISGSNSKELKEIKKQNEILKQQNKRLLEVIVELKNRQAIDAEFRERR